MSEDDQGAEKSFDPTPKRLEDARKKGEIPKSTDLTAAAGYLGLILSIFIAAPVSLVPFNEALAKLLSEPDHLSDLALREGGPLFFSNVAKPVIQGIWPFFTLPAFLVLLTLIAQQAILFAPSKLAPKLSKISPISGAKNKFGAKGLFEFIKSSAKLALVSALLVWFAMGKMEGVIIALMTNPAQIMLRLSDVMIEFLTLVFIMSLTIGGVDYLWQVSEHYRKNRMTRQEVTDEAKQSEGDPHHKQQRRQRGYDIAMNQMLKDVPTADVVIVNPTHFAVALTWNRQSGLAPVCVAKGVDEIAFRIREIASESQVAIHSDPPTARALYATVELGNVINEEHYRAVAAAIRFAEEMRSKAKRRVT